MMRQFLAVAVIFTLASISLGHPHPEREPLESLTGIKGGVKGGVKGRHPVSLNNTFLGEDHYPNLRNLTGSSHTVHNNGSTPKRDMEKGVCYKEVKTVTLVKDPHNVPQGNGSTPEYSKIRTCCPGFERNPHNFRLCEPVCENECINAKCIAPNVCACYPDHVLNQGGFCVPTCPISCLNGKCGDDNQCVCNHGYTLDGNGKFCVPHCSKGCSHGNCTEPEVCTCESGFQVNTLGQCAPRCDDGCVNGDCIAPNTCQCKPGYVKDQHGKCAPVCTKPCVQGECIAPDTCSCGDGYQMDPTGTQCNAYCKDPCLNGDCTGPNQCTCRKGYVKDVQDPSKCVGHCPNGCPNGICSGPNLCLCLPGYYKERGVKGSQRCVKKERRSLPHPLKIMF